MSIYFVDVLFLSGSVRGQHTQCVYIITSVTAAPLSPLIMQLNALKVLAVGIVGKPDI